ncbi:hypothetical protein CSKR_104197, partial [Clonorchis sinensis]
MQKIAKQAPIILKRSSGFLIYKRSDKYGAQDLRQIMGLESSTSGGFCDIVNALFMQQTFWYSEHYQGCRPLDDVTEIPSLIASISFDYAGLGAYMSLHESCFRKLSNIMNSIIHTTLNGKLVDEPTFNVRVAGIPNPISVPDPSWLESHRQNPFKHNPICFDLKWTRLYRNGDVCLYSENERHQIEVQISGQLMDPIRWNFEPELYTPFYDQARIYTAQSLSKSLGNMGLLDYVLTMKPEAFRVQDELRGLVGDVRLIFDLFSLGAELKTKEPGIILSTLKSRMQMPKNIDETYTFHVTDAHTTFSKVTCGVPLPGKITQEENEYSNPLIDMKRNADNLPDLSENLFWCLHVGTEWVRFGYRTI